MTALVASKELLNNWCEFSRCANVELQTIFHVSLSEILCTRYVPSESVNLTSSRQNDADIDLLKQLFAAMNPNGSAIQQLFESLGAFNIEFRHSIFNVLFGIAKYDWGIQAIVGLPGLPDYMLNRDTEKTVQGKQWKYDILKRIVEHPNGKSIVGIDNFVAFNFYVNCGAFFEKTESAVAIKDEFSGGGI